MKARWNLKQSRKLYGIQHWSGQYFDINKKGHLCAHPRQSAKNSIDLKHIIDTVKKKGLPLPILIRFQDIIRHRVESINQAFQTSIKAHAYQGKYKGVYPLKANQMREVLDEILDAGHPYDFGLEAGSKAELLIVLAMDLPVKALIICNGYKDRDFLKAALIGNKLQKRVIIVIEKLTELLDVITLSEELKVRPIIGIRAKLSAKGTGRWSSSGGEFAKFGLTTTEILQSIELLKAKGLEDCLKLLHFHIGSQVTHIGAIKDAVKEATRIYAKLNQMGLTLEYLDVGGGLGVDYDGSQSNFDSSMNYNLQQYVNDVVYSIQEICRAENVQEPHIVSESGRAIVAHHSVLVVNVFGTIEVAHFQHHLKDTPADNVVLEMRYILKNIYTDNTFESFQDAVARKEEALSKFKLGYLSLEDRAEIETLFWKICKNVYEHLCSSKKSPEEIENLKKSLAAQYLCNFSLFQSIPDHWAIAHLFPIMPLHRLKEKPTEQTTLVDITCDSDGKISKFIDLKDIQSTLRLHPLQKGQDYYLGFFLMGAYQDIMGDLHNLFGRVNEVHVFLDENEKTGYYIEEVLNGNTISEVISLIQYNASDIEKKLKKQLDKHIKKGTLRSQEGVCFQQFYKRMLYSYTYLNN